MSDAVSKKSKQPDMTTADHEIADPAGEAGAREEPAARTEETAAPDDAQASADSKDLEQQLDEARATAEAHWETVLRTRAELENLRKRSERDLENAHKYGVERFVSEMLPVKDSLELGLSASRDDEVSVESVREGMELTLKMFATALDKLGVKEVNPEGEGFDPDYHQAMTMQEAEDQASGTVISVIQKGYLLNERLIRPALVVVAK